ncbi:Na(+)-translocating NADH-quinone reductase subunit A [Desulfotalea psychrophila]|uniref:Na(+)-translocating NADH-quinone reductase subunit A n=1 Tax=Desulfotalea psychrophila (strain LSv54 / DSM 12343) TaxID=177439 RepID=Q6AM94_DESPS|nr:Na(+)-translocating NADH-quinone reductase subunit A [Desulfotalea psychrophila]CAG36531.1 probable Na+-translocating NADH:quinone oxidoreductase, subunit A [Desulfotalea psychrophila LSv54]
MKTFCIKKGLNIPIKGVAGPQIRQGKVVDKIALIADDYVGLRPTMKVEVGDKVICGQLLFTDKQTPGIRFTAPAAGTISAINRGGKRKFLSLVIDLAKDLACTFLHPEDVYTSESIGDILIQSGLWTCFRTRPYGKIPGIETSPHSLFITASDSAPLAPLPQSIIAEYSDEYSEGLRQLRAYFSCPIYYCTNQEALLPAEELEGLDYNCFLGPHPAGLASTHIHFLDSASEDKTVWNISYQDVISIGYLFRTGRLMTERIIAITGPSARQPSLLRTHIGADIHQLCRDEGSGAGVRTISGSVLAGRQVTDEEHFLGRYHNQICMLEESADRSPFNWAMPGRDKFSARPIFASLFSKGKTFSMKTALYGGFRAIYPLGSHEQVMPLDILATPFLQAISNHNTSKAKDLGCLELIEEDLALCSFVCPGKNEFASVLRGVLASIEQGD